MPASNQHIVQKVNAHLHIGERKQQSGQSERLKEAIERSVNKLAVGLDRVPGDTLRFIDRVSVEITLSEWNSDTLEEKLDAALAEKIGDLFNASQEDMRVKGAEKSVLTGREKYQKLITYFLQTGRLPWWAVPADLATSRTQLDEFTSSEWVEFLKPFVRQSPSALKRFVNQWTKGSVLGVIKKIAKKRFGRVSIVSLLNGLLAFDELNRDFDRENPKTEQVMCEKVLRSLIQNKSEIQITEDLILIWLKNHGESQTEGMKHLRHLKKYLNKNKLIIPEVRITLDKISSQILSGDGENAEVPQDVIQQEDKFLISGEDSTVSVMNAGIVLLHNYLVRLFGRLGYMEDGEFRHPATRERAVCAMHFLATGESEFPEQELGFAKILCGWPSNEPINRFLQFSDYEKEECENLLSNVIDHWKVLKNTSTDGLRTSFLKRDGIIKKEAFGLTLYVEEQTHDILLQRLPWSFSVVKLPWMSELLSVQWRVS